MSSMVPEGWEIKRLKDVGHCVRGLTYSPDDVAEDGVLVLRSSNIQNGHLSFTDNVYVDLEIDDEYLSKKDDIVICVRNGSKHLIGKSAIVKEENMGATHGAFMTVFRSDKNDFIQHLIKSEKFFTFVSRDIGATINSINNSNLLQYKFEFPPRPEQQKIASILTSVDDTIEKTGEQISKLQDLKKGMMQELLTKGIGHTEFKDSPVGRIPKEWESTMLGNVCKFTQGVQIPASEMTREYKNGLVRYLYIRDFDSDNYLWFIKDDYSQKQVTTNDLVMANTGHTSGSVYKGKDGVLSNNAFKISFSQSILNTEFLYHFLQTDFFKNKIRQLFNSAGQPHVGHGNIAKMPIALPAVDEQIRIASSINCIETNMGNLKKKSIHLNILKKALMQDLLTGKVRVHA